MSEFVTHCFEPVYDRSSRILILGTMPSPASRENNFYYSHPRNRFWSVMARLFQCDVPTSAYEKKALLLREHIALWDVLRCCEIDGASDASIRAAQPNDIPSLLAECPDIRRVFTTGGMAYRQYCRFFGNVDAVPEAVQLPSTSPANARMSLDELCTSYRIILEYLQ